PAGDAGEFRGAARRLRLSHPHSRRSGEIAVLRGARLYAGAGAARGNGGASQEPAYSARRDRHAERLRHRQFRDSLRHESARRRCTRRSRHRREHAGERARQHGSRRHSRHIRLNLATGGTNDPTVARQRLETGIDRVKAHGWHVQLYTNLKMISALKDQFAAAPVSIVFDHFAGAQAELGPDQPGFAEVIELVRSGKAYVKISGAYRASKAAPDNADVVPLARALIAANPDRILWGTDWPHPDSVTPSGKKPTDATPLLQIDDARLLNQLPV